MKRPRRGSTFPRSGKIVERRDHLWEPPARKNLSADETSRGRRAGLALNGMADTGEDLPAKSKVLSRHDFGLPVPEKANWHDTEIGVVEFTEDLVEAFDDYTTPVTEKEAWDIVTEAADRYARLSAFIAAEQRMTCDELCSLPTRFTSPDMGYDTSPQRMVAAVKRRRGESVVDDDELVDRIVATLDGTADEDAKVLVAAARGFRTYLTQNRSMLCKNPRLDVGLNLESALLRADPENPIIQVRLKSGPNFNDDDRIDATYVFDVEEHKSGRFLRTVRPETMTELEQKYERSPSTPFLEHFNVGVRINLTDEWSVEISDTCYMRRVYRRDGVRHVLDSRSWSPQEGVPKGKPSEVLLAAANFRRPFYTLWTPDNMVGFSQRNSKK